MSRNIICLVIMLNTAVHAGSPCIEMCTVIHEYVGTAPGDYLGWKTNNLGDLSGDGVNDFIITANGFGANAGRAYVYCGSSGALMLSIDGQPGWSLGTDANAVGDVNGDGVHDIIIGAPTGGTGRALLVSGAAPGDGETPTVLHTFNGEQIGARFGYRVAGPGDVDDDGTPDVLITALLHDQSGLVNAGRAYIYSGADYSLMCTIDGPSPNAQFGSGANPAGDMDGDGRADFIITAPNAGAAGLGYVYTFDGRQCNVLHTLTPSPGGMNAGSQFADGGCDVNDDGIPDAYVGDWPGNRASVFDGGTGDELFALTGTDGFGLGELIDDVNNDGHADLVIAAFTSNDGAPGAGKLFVYSGADQTILETFTHNVAGAGMGFDAKGIGDVNGDGRADYIAAAANENGNTGRVYILAGTIGGIPADLNHDGIVNGTDLLLLLNDWGQMGAASDLDDDGLVNGTDLLILLNAWG